jgi:lipopolysaccharide/colanic/teichoic acid biosynthesis glycosyltransferase
MSVDKGSFQFEPGVPFSIPASRPLITYAIVKRTMDIAGALVLGGITLPLLLAMVLLIRRDGGPAFFSQQRLGGGGEIFRFWKLRTMVHDAEAVLERYLAGNPEAREEWDRTQKLRHDPRVTPMGRILRKYSLDELPQLWNVLRGDMSLIGPRPMFVVQRELYPGLLYGGMRPGITGLWQVTDRNQCSFAERARFDQLYAERISLRTDTWIVLRTIRAVFSGTGC